MQPKLSALTSAVHDQAAGVLGDNAFVFGGAGPTAPGTYDTIQSIAPTDKKAAVVGKLPQPRTGATAFTDSGGPSPNVVQPTARLYYLVRAPDVPQMRALYERVVKIAEGAALMTETSLAVEFDGGSAELLQNAVLEQAMHDIAVRLGPVPFDDADRRLAQPFLATVSPAEVAMARAMAGIDASDPSPLHDGIIPFDATAPRQRAGGSTDVGDVSWVVPTVQCTGAVAALGTPAHAWQLVAQGKMAAAHKGMIHAAKIMGATAASLLTDDGLLARARDEFDTRITQRPYDCPIPEGVLAPPLRER